MPDERRMATLFAFARVFEATAQDEALDLLDQLISTLLARAERRGQQQRLRTLRDLDQAALHLAAACAVLLDPRYGNEELRLAAFARVPPEKLAGAVTLVEEIAPPQDTPYYEEILDRYPYVRRFLPALLRTIGFTGTEAGQPVLAALAYLKRIEGQRRPNLDEAPKPVVTRAWHPLVFQRRHQVAHRRYYTFCVLERLQEDTTFFEIPLCPLHKSSRHKGCVGAIFLSHPVNDGAILEPSCCRETSGRRFGPRCIAPWDAARTRRKSWRRWPANWTAPICVPFSTCL
jgi:hypothetical protein